MMDRIEYCKKCKDETMHVVSGSGKYKTCLECPPEPRTRENCKFCGEPVVVETKYGGAEYSHWNCLYDAVEPVRDGLQ
jgi:hypothetical protein